MNKWVYLFIFFGIVLAFQQISPASQIENNINAINLLFNQVDVKAWDENYNIDDLKLTLSIKKNKIKMAYSLEVVLEIKNQSDHQLLLNGNLIADVVVCFNVVDKDGLQMPPQYLIHPKPPTDNDFIRLSSGRKLVGEFNLKDHYKIDNPGKYKVSAWYAPINYFKKGTWTGSVESNVIEFELEN